MICDTRLSTWLTFTPPSYIEPSVLALLMHRGKSANSEWHAEAKRALGNIDCLFLNLWTYKQKWDCSLSVRATCAALWLPKMAGKRLLVGNSELSKPSWMSRWFLKDQEMWCEAMALGHGSKKSISCDQGITHASLSNGVSNTEILKLQQCTLIYVLCSDFCVSNIL